MANHCDEVLSDWLEPVAKSNDVAKVKTDGTMAQNLECVFCFMEVCCREFKVYDPAMLEKVALRASAFAFDTAYRGQCKQISFRILNLLTTKCRPGI